MALLPGRTLWILIRQTSINHPKKENGHGDSELKGALSVGGLFFWD